MDNYKIVFYEEADGTSPVFDFFEKLTYKAKTSKQSRTLLNTFYRRLNTLKISGTSDGRPKFDSIKGSKYHLREIRIKHKVGYYRILFCLWNSNNFVLLHCLLKKTDKTPPADIKKAEKRIEDWLNRNGGKV